jgi:hypothetical protein
MDVSLDRKEGKSMIADSQIKDELKKMPNNGCRICKNFVRVNQDHFKNVVNRRGFCLLGRLEGDYSLYTNGGNVDDECMGYVPDQLIYNIFKAEQDLSNDENNFVSTLGDRRSKNYKLIKPVIDGYENIYKQGRTDHFGINFLWDLNKERMVGREWFYSKNIERYKEVYEMVSIKQTDYNKFISKVSVEIHKWFCDCDCVEFKDDKMEGVTNNKYGL